MGSHPSIYHTQVHFIAHIPFITSVTFLAKTKDMVQWPNDYGKGSGTIRTWILLKMAEDKDQDALYVTKTNHSESRSRSRRWNWSCWWWCRKEPEPEPTFDWEDECPWICKGGIFGIGAEQPDCCPEQGGGACDAICANCCDPNWAA